MAVVGVGLARRVFLGFQGEKGRLGTAALRARRPCGRWAYALFAHCLEDVTGFAFVVAPHWNRCWSSWCRTDPPGLWVWVPIATVEPQHTIRAALTCRSRLRTVEGAVGEFPPSLGKDLNVRC